MRVNGLVRLTHDPAVRSIVVDGDDRSVCSMRCAIRASRGRDAGFVDVVAWGPLAERCAEHLAEGNPAYVDGHLRQEEWTGVDGTRQQRHRIIADDVQFLGRLEAADRPVAVDGTER